MVNQLTVIVRRGLGTVRDTAGVSALVASTIAAALLVAGVYSMALRNLEALAAKWQASDVVTVYVADSLTEPEWEPLRTALASMEGVAQATVITPQVALQRFRDRGPQAAALVEGVEDTMLPTTVILKLTENTRRDPQKMQQLLAAVEASNGVQAVDDGHEDMAQIDGLLRVLHWIGTGINAVLLLITAVIISNTVRLTIHARREEIGIWHMVGATRWFVRGPFIVEGMVWGVAGGVAASAALACIDGIGSQRLTQAMAHVMAGWTIDLFDWRMALMLVGNGALLGVVGSFLAVRRMADHDQAARA